MATLFSSPESMQPEAASLSRDYPQFVQVNVPDGSGAIAAWEGYIQPFLDDTSARAYLRVVEADGQIQISEGTIYCFDEGLSSHPKEQFLVGMAQRCKVMILQMPAPAHPRAFLLEPLYSSAFLSYHPHPRGDISIPIGRYRAQGLCVYSAAEYRYSTDDRLVEFLDLVTTHVARHLIWLRTRRLYELANNGKLNIIYKPRPGELIVDNEVGVKNLPATSLIPSPRRFWAGYWPGKEARASNRLEHLANIRKHDECWCGSGITYEKCCRPREFISRK